jgi:feruloyl esterase
MAKAPKKSTNLTLPLAAPSPLTGERELAMMRWGLVPAKIALADKLDNGVISANDPDLRKFFAHGGKLILYYGWSDPMISPQNTIRYYKNVLHTSGNQAETSVRLFMAPGMDHCGGEGQFAFDMDDALSQWVEQDKAPG